jgi:3-hydroxyacyl-[acyl-carrier-protein] dehydratase
VLTVTAEIAKQDEQTTRLKAKGMVEGRDAVSARLTLEKFNLADRTPSRSVTDATIITELRKDFHLLYDPPPPVEDTA